MTTRVLLNKRNPQNKRNVLLHLNPERKKKSIQGKKLSDKKIDPSYILPILSTELSATTKSSSATQNTNSFQDSLTSLQKLNSDIPFKSGSGMLFDNGSNSFKLLFQPKESPNALIKDMKVKYIVNDNPIEKERESLEKKFLKISEHVCKRKNKREEMAGKSQTHKMRAKTFAKENPELLDGLFLHNELPESISTSSKKMKGYSELEISNMFMELLNATETEQRIIQMTDIKEKSVGVRNFINLITKGNFPRSLGLSKPFNDLNDIHFQESSEEMPILEEVDEFSHESIQKSAVFDNDKVEEKSVEFDQEINVSSSGLATPLFEEEIFTPVVKRTVVVSEHPVSPKKAETSIAGLKSTLPATRRQRRTKRKPKSIMEMSPHSLDFDEIPQFKDFVRKIDFQEFREYEPLDVQSCADHRKVIVRGESSLPYHSSSLARDVVEARRSQKAPYAPSLQLANDARNMASSLSKTNGKHKKGTRLSFQVSSIPSQRPGVILASFNGQRVWNMKTASPNI